MQPTKIFKKTPHKQRLAIRKKVATEYERARERFLFGSLGAASPVRRIDPRTGKVVALIDPETGATLSKQASRS